MLQHVPVLFLGKLCFGGRSDDKRLILRVPLDVAADEGAERQDLQVIVASIVECRLRERAPDAGTFHGFGDSGMREDDHRTFALIKRDGEFAVLRDFKPVLGFVVDDSWQLGQHVIRVASAGLEPATLSLGN